MTKERLEELVKQGGTIYNHNGDEIQLINSKETRYNISDNGYLHISCLANFKYHGSDRWIDVYIEPDKLYETKEQAKWHTKMVAERTERFDPPMWEDIEDNYEFNFLIETENIYKRILFYVSRNTSSDKIFLKDDFDSYIIFDTNATKENYEKACEIVRDLFKGGK